MKKLLFGAALLLLAAGSVQAQDHKGMHKKRGFKGGHHMNAEKLNLTQEQKDRMNAINADFKKQMEDLRKQDNITVKESKERREAIVKNHRDQLQGLLTKEQKDQMAKMREEGKAKREQYGKERGEKMKQELGLTNEQAEKLSALNKRSAEERKNIFSNQSLTAEQKKAQMQTLKERQKTEMKSILTAEQLKKLEEKRGKHGKGKKKK